VIESKRETGGSDPREDLYKHWEGFTGWTGSSFQGLAFLLTPGKPNNQIVRSVIDTGTLWGK